MGNMCFLFARLKAHTTGLYCPLMIGQIGYVVAARGQMIVLVHGCMKGRGAGLAKM